jgi:hypothetical protein
MNTRQIDALFARKIAQVKAALAEQTVDREADEVVPFEVNKVLRQLEAHQQERTKKALKNKTPK